MLAARLAPPVTYQGVYNSGIFLRYGSSDNGNSLTLHARQKVATIKIVYDIAGNPVADIFSESLDGQLFYGTWFGKLVAPYAPPPIDALVNIHQEYYIDKVCFEFVPRVGTSNDLSLTWAWLRDVEYPEAHSSFTYTTGPFTSGGFVVSEVALSRIPSARQFPCWAPEECMDVTREIDQMWRYTAGPDQGYNPFNPSDSAADQRQTYFGCLCVAGDLNESDEAKAALIVNVGSIYCEYKIRLRGLGETISRNISFSNKLEKSLRRLKLLPEEKEGDDSLVKTTIAPDLTDWKMVGKTHQTPRKVTSVLPGTVKSSGT